MAIRTFRPMLAEKLEVVEDCRFPKLVSPKIDGLRCVIRNGVPYTRNMLPIANDLIQRELSGLPPLDGELIVGDATDADLWNKSVSAVRTKTGEPEFVFSVFDVSMPDHLPFRERYRMATTHVEELRSSKPHLRKRLAVVPHTIVNTLSELMRIEEQLVSAGYEGVMLRDLEGPYKWGRSTLNEQFLLKLKRFVDMEVIIIGAEPAYTNNNEATIDPRGLTKRSTHKENLVQKDELGALIVQIPGCKSTTRIGSGFDSATRKQLWMERDKLPGRIATMKCQSVSETGIARFPIWKGFRDDHI